MKEFKMNNKDIFDKMTVILYRLILPIISFIFLIIVSQFESRVMVFNSLLVDFIIRAFLTAWFCVGFYKLPRLAKDYHFFPGKDLKKSEVSTIGKIYSISMAILFGILIGVITQWVILTFLPDLGSISLLIAIIIGFLYTIPLIAQYQIIRAW
jgi:hypothetical protein